MWPLMMMGKVTGWAVPGVSFGSFSEQSGNSSTTNGITLETHSGVLTTTG